MLGIYLPYIFPPSYIYRPSPAPHAHRRSHLRRAVLRAACLVKNSIGFYSEPYTSWLAEAVMLARAHLSGASTHYWALCCDPHASGFCGLQSCGHRLANRSIGPQQEAEYRETVRELRTASYMHMNTLSALTTLCSSSSWSFSMRVRVLYNPYPIL